MRIFYHLVDSVRWINSSENRMDISKKHRLEWWLEELDWSDTHSYTGKGVKIAVLDSGIDFSHADLSHCKHFEVRVSGLSKRDKNARQYGVNHGTEVAGIIAGRPSNEKGVWGIAEDSFIYSIDITDSPDIEINNVIEGLKLAIEYDVDIINMSIGIHENSKKLHRLIKKAYNKGIIIVAAAGNYMKGKVLYPAKYDEVLCVGALKKDGAIISPQNYLSNEIVYLPGENIVTTTSGKKQYCGVTGTSFSSAILTGIIAVMKNDGTIIIDDNELIQDYSDVILNNAEMMVLDEDSFDNQSVADMEELMDNGTDLVVKTDNYKDLCKTFDASMKLKSNGTVVGCYIESDDNEGYSVNPIIYDVMYDKELDKSEYMSDEEEKEFLNTIVNTDGIDYNQVQEDAELKKQDDEIANLSFKKLNALQAGGINAFFKERTVFQYFYKKGGSGGVSTDYKYSSANAIQGWTWIGSMQLNVRASKVKTLNNTTTYDNVYCIFTASPDREKRVSCFNAAIWIPGSNQGTIIDASEVDGKDGTSKTSSFNANVSSSGDVGIGTSQSYTYNPNGMKVKGVFVEKHYKEWQCTPCDTSSLQAGKSYIIKPCVLVRKKNGKTENTVVKAGVWKFSLYGGVRWYTITDWITCQISFKNHGN